MKYEEKFTVYIYYEYHLLFVTEYRSKIFNNRISAYMFERLRQVKDHYLEIDIIKINYNIDHMYMLVLIPSWISVSEDN